MVRSSLILGALLSFLLPTALQAQSPHAGNYNGFFYARLSGLVDQPESGFGPALINIDANGAVTQSGGGLLGHANASGTVTWQTPNAFLFTSGTIRDGVISASGSRSDAGLTTTFRLEARRNNAAFGSGGGFGQALRLVHPIPHADELRGITHGNGTYLAVGRGGVILRSPDASRWLHIPTGRGTTLQDVAFGDGRFVAVGHGGLVLVSTDDGLTWSTADSGSSFDLHGVAHGHGRFVAVGRAGIRSSADGLAWTAVTPADSTADQWDSVDFINGRFIAVGGRSGTGLHNEITTSTDGLAWTPAQSYNAGFRTGTYQAAFGNGTYVVTAGSGLGPRTYTFSGDDGSGATVRTPPHPFLGILFDSAQGRFLGAVDRNGGEIHASADGVAWSLVATNTGTRSEELLQAGGRFLAAGMTLAASNDGTAWTRITTNAPTLIETPVTSAGPDVAYAAHGTIRGFGSMGSLPTAPTLLDVAGGPSGSLYGVGPAGTLMQLRPLPSRLDSGTAQDLRGIGSNAADRGQLLVAVGDAGTLLTSINGFIWTPRTSGVPVRLNDADADASRVVVVGENGTILTAPVSDLSRWTPVPSGVTNTLRSVTHQQFLRQNDGVTVFVAVGDAGVVLTSEDTLTWTRIESVPPMDLVSVLLAPGRNPTSLFALGADGHLLVSTNQGSAWMDAGVRLGEPGVALSASQTRLYAAGRHTRFLSTTASGTTPWQTNTYAPPPPSSGMSGVAHGNGRFVTVGPNSTGISDDGESWTFHHLPADLGRITFGNSRFVAVGPGGVAATSTDGTHWQTRSLGSTTLGDVTYGGGQFVAVGALGKAFTSPDGMTWTERPTGASTTLEAVAFGNGVYSAVGTTQATSTNGVTWQTLALPRNIAYHDIHFADSLWVRVGENNRAGIIQTSTNGTTWATRHQLSGNSQLYGVGWLGGLWVAVGEPSGNDQGAGVYTSTNGIAWTATSAHRNGPLRAIAGGNGIALAVGDGGTLLKAEYPDLRSPVITRAPADTTVAQGTTLTLHVEASGDAPLTYQWSRDGVALADGGRLSGSTGPTLTLEGALPADAGTYSVSVANPAGSRVSSPAQATVTTGGGPTPSFESWARSFPIPVGEDGPADDPDRDGIANVAEFAFGSDPTRPDSGELPTIALADEAGAAYPAVSYVRDPRVAGVRIEVSASHDLGFLSPVDTVVVGSPQPLPNGLERITVRATTPAAGLDRIFFRSNVVRTP